MVVGAALRRSATEGLRPFDPARDVGQVSALLRDAFREELSAEELVMLREMGALRYAAPLLWVMSQISPEFQANFGGFVWVEGGRVVGNASLTSADEDGRHWVISNVAVAPEYRRRGIAYELMRAAIKAARERGGHAVTLQVRADNVAAQSLYQKLGFVRLESTAYLWLERVTPVPTASLRGTTSECPPGLAGAAGQYRLQPWDRTGSHKAYELALSLAPAALKRMRPLRRESFDLPPQHPALLWLLGLAWGRISRGWAIEEQGRYLATLVLEVAVWRGYHHLHLLIHPDLRGHVEELLVGHALDVFRRHPRSVEGRVRTDHQEAIATLQQHGFITRRVLDRLGLELVPRVTIRVRSKEQP